MTNLRASTVNPHHYQRKGGSLACTAAWNYLKLPTHEKEKGRRLRETRQDKTKTNDNKNKKKDPQKRR